MGARPRALDQRTRVVEMDEHLVATALPPGDVRQHEGCLGRRLSLPSRKQPGARFGQFWLALLLLQIQRAAVAQQDLWTARIAVGNERERLPEVPLRLR